MSATIGVLNLPRINAPAPVVLEPLPRIEGTTLSELPGLFDEVPSVLDGVKVLIAEVNSWGYEEDAYVVYLKGRELYEIEASHCSCNGFEGQWRPGRITLRYLEMKVKTAQNERYLRYQGLPEHAKNSESWRNQTLEMPATEQHIRKLLEYWATLPEKDRPE